MRKFWSIVTILLFLGYLYFPFFLHLELLPLQLWDESLFAMRAYYLAETGELLPNFAVYPGITNYENLKPPLGTYLQALSYYCFGYSILSLRLVASLFGLGIIGLFLWISRKISSKYLIGIISTLILVSCTGFVRTHVLRTGDHETITLFFMLLQIIFFYLYNERDKSIFWYLFIGALLASFYTKSIFGFFLLPAFFLFVLINKNLFVYVRNPHTYLGILLVMIGVSGYYFIMDKVIPGFLQFEIDTVFGRYNSVRDNQSQPSYFYLWAFVRYHFLFWTPVLLGSLFFLKQIKEEAIRKWLLLLGICWISTLAIISMSATKLAWYDALLYPIASLIIGTVIGTQVHQLKKRKYLWGIFFIWLGVSYFFTLQNCYFPNTVSDSDNYGIMLEKLQQDPNHPHKKFMIYCYEYNGQVGFYSKLFNDQYQYNIDAMVYWQEEKVQSGDLMMACEKEKIDRIQENYEVEILEEQSGCFLMKLGNQKENREQ